MALSRDALLGIVAGEQHDVLALARIADADQPGALKEPLDRCFRALGVAEAELASADVVDGGEERAIAFATYFVLARATLALVGKKNVAAGRTRANLREQYENVRERTEAALAIAQGYGLAVAGNGRGGAVPLPYGGGIDAGDAAAVADDPCRVPPLFGLARPGPGGWGA